MISAATLHSLTHLQFSNRDHMSLNYVSDVLTAKAEYYTVNV